MTKPHSDRIINNQKDRGYSIRVGENIPQNSANLAYVHSPGISPSSNLNITDLTSQIKENGLDNGLEREVTVFPDKDFLLRELDGDYRFATPDVIITDEYSIPATKQDKPRPLYYEAETKGLFDAKGAMVYDYLNGYIDTPILKPKNFAEYLSPKPNELLYLGSKIQVTNLDGTSLENGKEYKVKLVQQEGEGVPPNAYRIVVYTNFKGNKDATYLVRYEKYNMNGTHASDHTEILNAYSFFTQTEKESITNLIANSKIEGEWNPALDQKKFSVEATENGDYLLYAPSRVITADENGVRPSQQFKYRINGFLQNKFNEYNPGKVRIGYVNLNLNIPNVESLSGVMNKLYTSPLRPQYLEFENPHPPEGEHDKTFSTYWEVDLNMHEELLKEYDILFLFGYGNYDMKEYSNSLRKYLENGGRVWVDNNGTNAAALNLTNFLTNVQFSATQTSAGNKHIGSKEGEPGYSLSRYHDINEAVTTIGYPGINPKMAYGPGEAAGKWSVIAKYPNEDPSIITRSIQGKGHIFISNCGIGKAVMHNSLSGDESAKILINTILAAAERKWVQTPWLNDSLLHRNSLFQAEYQQGNTKLYFDDLNDQNNKEIVAKKIISKTVRDAIIPYIDPVHYNAQGIFTIDLDSDSPQFISNADFESGNVSGSTQFITTTIDAIPGWKASINGEGYLGHASDFVQRGNKSIKIAGPATGSGSQLYWSVNKQINETGSYTLNAWVKTSAVSGVSTTGLTIAVYSDNQKRAMSVPVVGTQDWQQISVTFGVTEPKEFEFRFGFTDGLAIGTGWCDEITLVKQGSVYMTPENDGNKILYAYTVKPGLNGFNFQAEGFTNGDITIYDRYVEAMARIQAFTYHWSNSEGKYVKKYSTLVNSVPVRVRKSDGLVNLGLATTLLPGLPEGQEWSDRDKVFYEFSVEAANQEDADQTRVNNDYLFINGGFFNTETGRFTKTQEGKHVLAHIDVYHPQKEDSESQFVVQVWTSYTTIRATKRRYSVLVDDKDRMEIAYPATIDERDSWYPRIKNGRFTIRKMDSERYALYYKDRNYYQSKDYWNFFSYSLPEYDRQVYYPSKGIKRIQEEIPSYVDEYTIRTQNSPLYVLSNQYHREPSKKIRDSKYSDGKTRYYKFSSGIVLVNKSVKVFVKESGANDFIEYVDMFDIDYTNGLVIFTTGIDAEVEVTFERDNLQVIKRKYDNNMMTEESLVSYDKKTYASAHANWLAFPTPKIYQHGAEGKEIVPVTSYEIDYDSGSISFKEETSGPVFGTYLYSSNEVIKVKDYDIQSGLIHLESPITFKDDLYVNYMYEEGYVEYRGYYDEQARRFIKLDLNPSEGHSCTVRRVQKDFVNGDIVVFDDTPTSKLVNKEIYLYILPRMEANQVINDHTLRHCFSKREWEILASTNPHAILMAVMHIRENAKVEDVTVMDARRRGGGLKKEISKQQIEKKSELSTGYWDIGPFDGEAYYSNGVILIQLPKSILIENGGRFSPKDVDIMIKKYVAFGVYYNIEYVD